MAGSWEAASISTHCAITRPPNFQISRLFEPRLRTVFTGNFFLEDFSFPWALFWAILGYLHRSSVLEYAMYKLVIHLLPQKPDLDANRYYEGSHLARNKCFYDILLLEQRCILILHKRDRSHDSLINKCLVQKCLSAPAYIENQWLAVTAFQWQWLLIQKQI